MDLTDFAANKLARHVTGIEAVSMPTQLYLALYVTPTQASGSGTESDVDRVPVDFDDDGRAVISDGTVAPESSGQPIVAAALLDHLTAGDMWFHKVLSTTINVPEGQPITWQAGDIVVRF